MNVHDADAFPLLVIARRKEKPEAKPGKQAKPGTQYIISYHRTVALAAKGRDAARKNGFLGGLQVVVLDNGFADMRA